MTPERRRAIVAERKAASLCIDCPVKRVRHADAGVRCSSCAERHAETVQAWKASPRGRKLEAARQQRRRAKLVKHGLCWCSAPAAEGRRMCEPHLAAHAANQAVYLMRREGEAAPVERVDIAPAPRLRSFDPIYDYRNGEVSLAEAATRYVELHNGIEARDVGDAFGADDHERNAISKALSRALASGRVTARGEGMERVFFPVRQRRAA